MNFVEINSDEDFAREVEGHQGYQLGVFTADWCPHCKNQAPVMMEILQGIPDVRLCRIDIDKAEASTEKLQVLTIPTIAVFKDGKMVGSLMFAHSTKDEISTFINTYYNK